VAPGGPADRAGIRGGTTQEAFLGETIWRGGDVIVTIGTHPVHDADELVRIVTNSFHPGQTVDVGLVRDGRRRTVALTLAQRQAR
jgi:2-alkenal reductase